MKLPRNLSGRNIIAILVSRFDYRIVHERGSHIILETDKPSHQRIAIPDHKNLRLGTLSAILKIVASHKKIERETIVSLF
jgi:predicted RNA binding protein YcfA (HicA-like mRNA interferase family)